jgi:biotin carboxylase
LVPAVLFLGGGISQVGAILQARSSGYRTVVVDGDPNVPGLAAADAGAAIDFTDVDAVTSFAEEQGIDAVVAIAADRAVPVAAAIAERLGLPGIGVETSFLMTNKAAMRARLAECGVPQPRHTVLTELVEPSWAVEAVGLPAVLKPVDSGGQRGVFRIASSEELAACLPKALAYSRSSQAILESYVEGGELNGIVVVRGGEPTVVTLSDRLRPPGAGFGVGWIHLHPSALDPAVLESVACVGVAAVRALGLRDGIAFPQLLVSDAGRPHVVEVGARVPAGQMADLVRLGTGVDLIEIALTQALGGVVTDAMVEPRFQRPIAIRFLTASPGILPVGRVTSVDGLDEVRASPGVLQAELHVEAGDVIRPVQVDADRLGYVIAAGDDPRAALDLAQAAARRLRVTVDRH